MGFNKLSTFLRMRADPMMNVALNIGTLLGNFEETFKVLAPMVKPVFEDESNSKK